jgi:sugar O-acyltransferase (sialic acid O-acetyltransferase NeuD family)
VKKDIAIYGAGGFGREISAMIEQINSTSPQWNFIGFFDDQQPEDKAIDNGIALGDMNKLNRWPRPISLALCIADPIIRRSVAGRISNPQIQYPVLVHPSASIAASRNRFGEGTIITAGCILTTNITVGRFVIINLATTIGHDTRLKDFCSIMPGCRISGNVSIGEETLVGTGVSILQNLRIGNKCRIGAGAVLINDISDGVTAVGVPAKPIRSK